MKYGFILVVSLVSFILFSSSVFFSQNPNMEGEKMKIAENHHLELATFAGGYFWCTETDFEKVPGVINVTSGYQKKAWFNSPGDRVTVFGNSLTRHQMQLT